MTWLGSSIHCVLKDLPICNRSSCPVVGLPGGVNRRPGLKLLPEMPQISLQSSPVCGRKLGLSLISVFKVSVDLLEDFEKEAQKLEKEKAEEPEVGDDWDLVNHKC